MVGKDPSLFDCGNKKMNREMLDKYFVEHKAR